MPHYYLPLISQPTRITTTTSTLIDNIFTNLPQRVVETVIVVSDIYDHLPLPGLTLLKSTHPKLPLTNTLDALARNQLQNLGTVELNLTGQQCHYCLKAMSLTRPT